MEDNYFINYKSLLKCDYSLTAKVGMPYLSVLPLPVWNSTRASFVSNKMVIVLKCDKKKLNIKIKWIILTLLTNYLS
jgi:hypothetical protein